jgi:[protein-PII] uridylyltransferase
LAGDELSAPSPSLPAVRLSLLDDRSLTGTEWCRRYAAAADRWLAGVLDQAVGGDTRGVALLAVGGYGRGELAPGSDLDLLLVHDRRGRIDAVADAVWYPIWDAGVHLDHSVRTVKDVRNAMDGDIKVALGLLDGRRVAGDAELARKVLARALEQWQTRIGRWLPLLDGLTRRRHERFGDLAFLLEPDLKEARGGLRDVYLLRSLGRVIPILAGPLDQPDLDAARDVLAAARVETHRVTGRPTNQLLLQDQDAVAAALGYPDADALMVAIAGAGRAGAWLNDDGWRRIESWLAGPAGRGGSADRALEPGLVIRDGEVTLSGDAPIATDPSLALRAAAASAELDRPIAGASLDRLGAEAVAPSGVWASETRHGLVRLLGAGRPAVAAVEALDQRGIWLRYLPEWAHVRNRPQRNAYHRFTVDRHLLETAANAAALAGRVDRPDLLLLGSLFHDIGKGLGGDHTEEGIELVGKIAPRLGLPDADVETLVAMVRLHLLLPDTATRRDLDDPATADATARAVGDRRTLELLAALTEADSVATGPSAWSPWKAALIDRLVDVTAAHLEGQPAPAESRHALNPTTRALLDRGRLDVLFDSDHGPLLVVAPDRAGLLATTAGVLTLSGVTIRSASTMSDPATGMALLSFVVAPAFDRLPDWETVRSDLDAALDGRLALGPALQERERHYARYRRHSAAVAPVIRVTIDDAASTTATVVEVRAPDRGPVLYQVTGAIASCGLTITRALVNTLGAEAVDVFYVQTVAGAKVGAGEQPRLTDALLAALGSGA